MKLRSCLLLLLTVCLPGCGSLPPRIGAFRAEKLIWPVRKVLLVTGQGAGIEPLTDSFSEKLSAEFQKRLQAHDVPTVSVVVRRKDLNADQAIRAALDEHYPTHQLTVVAARGLRNGAVNYHARASYEIKVSFMLSELQPYREVWRGEAGFAGYPSGAKIADEILNRLVADGILK